MDEGEPPAGCPTSFRELKLWIIEHVWTHNMTQVLRVVDASCWQDLDLQSGLLGEPWRLRVASACVFSIVRRRDVSRFERAMDVLDAAYSLLPALVPAIKHMKILFGLKTLIVMRMLRDGQGTVETMSKIIRFFPSKLPQYQGRCGQREMFLMRKNQQDFKSLAQALALDRNKLQDYVQNHMEQQYGEHYAQKVEDRLLQYLRQLQGALPGETHIDKLLRTLSPVTEQEKFLLDLMSSLLSTLLHCGGPSGGPARPPPTEGAGPSEVQPRGPRGSQEVSSGVRGLGPSGGPSGGAGQTPSPQFCSKHRRWVRSILQECPEEASESSSPPLFQSSSSTSSSQDLTPSDLVPEAPEAPDGPPSQSAGGPQLGGLMAGRIHVASDPNLNPDEASPDCFICRNQQAGPGPGPGPGPAPGPPTPSPPSGDRDSTSVQPDLKTPPEPDPGSPTSSRGPPMKRTSSAGSPDLSQTSPPCRPAQVRSRNPSAEDFQKDQDVSTSQRVKPEPEDPRDPGSTPQTDPRSREDPCPGLMVPVVRLVDFTSCCSFRPQQGPAGLSPPSPCDKDPVMKTPPESQDLEGPMKDPSRVQVVSPPPHLQPYVRLTRLSAEELRPIRAQAEQNQEADFESSFDLNELYSGSSGTGEEDPHPDPDYRPWIKKSRLLQEYESARVQHH